MEPAVGGHAGGALVGWPLPPACPSDERPSVESAVARLSLPQPRQEALIIITKEHLQTEPLYLRYRFPALGLGHFAFQVTTEVVEHF